MRRKAIKRTVCAFYAWRPHTPTQYESLQNVVAPTCPAFMTRKPNRTTIPATACTPRMPTCTIPGYW